MEVQAIDGGSCPSVVEAPVVVEDDIVFCNLLGHFFFCLFADEVDS